MTLSNKQPHFSDQESVSSLKTLLQNSLSAQKTIQGELREQLKLIRKVISNISQVTSGQTQEFDVLMLRLINELHTASKVNELNRTAKSLAKFATDPDHRLSVRLRESRARIQRTFRGMTNLNHQPELQRHVHRVIEQVEHPMTLQQLMDLLLHELFTLTEYSFKQGLKLQQAVEQNQPKKNSKELPFEQVMAEVSEHLRLILREMIEKGDISSPLIGEETRLTQQQLINQLNQEQELFKLMNMIIPSVNLNHVALRALAEHLSNLLNSLNSELEESGELLDVIKLGLQEIDSVVLEEHQHHVIQMRVSSKVVELLDLMNNHQSEAGYLTQQAISGVAEIRKQVAEIEVKDRRAATGSPSSDGPSNGADDLYHRKQFEQELIKQVEKSHLEKRPLSIAICSIDNLAQIASQHGNQLAIKLVSKISKVLITQLRSSDALYSLEPGSCALLLPSVIVQGLPTVLARLQQRLTHLPILYRKQKIELQVSLGGASLRDGETAHDLLQRTRKAIDYASTGDGQQVSVSHPNGVYTRCLDANHNFCLTCFAEKSNIDTSKGLYCGMFEPCTFSPELTAPDIQAISLDAMP